MLLSFLNIWEMTSLKDALVEGSIWHQMFFSLMHLDEMSPMETFSVLTFLRIEGAFDGYENLLEMSMPHSIFQNAAHFIDPESREGGDTIDKIKDTIIKKCINYFCRENQYVIDLFTKGMVSMHAIR